MNTFEKLESEVRGYCRSFPVTFDTAKGATMVDQQGRKYLDFFAGAGALNYGHNNDKLKEALLAYIERDGITHSLDMYTVAKQRFLERFNEVILKPRGMDYKFQFPGPTGTNAVEAAMKLARKATQRTNMVFFTNGFHGMTVGSLAVTGNEGKRHSAAQPLVNATAMPFDGYMGEGVDSLDYFEHSLEDRGSGLEMPAAVIVETIQAEGGVNVASREWMERLNRICKKHGIFLIVDDIQVGCGRTGSFFSFEGWDIDPDVICLSKSLSGYGLPFALVLLKPEHDIWGPGEHNGTFRGHMPAFVTATAALDFWGDDSLTQGVQKKSEIAMKRLEEMTAKYSDLKTEVRGRGMIIGVEVDDDGFADDWSAQCFERGMIIETAGIDDQVLKLLPSLTMTEEELKRGLDIIEDALAATVAARGKNAA